MLSGFYVKAGMALVALLLVSGVVWKVMDHFEYVAHIESENATLTANLQKANDANELLEKALEAKDTDHAAALAEIRREHEAALEREERVHAQLLELRERVDYDDPMPALLVDVFDSLRGPGEDPAGDNDAGSGGVLDSGGVPAVQE